MRIVSIELKCGYPDCPVQEPEGSDLMVTRTLTIDRRKPVEVDLCKTHNDLVFNDLLDALAADGRTISEPKPKRSSASSKPEPAPGNAVEELTCLETGCGRSGFKGGAGLAVHVTSKHGYSSLAAYKRTHNIEE